MTRISACVAWWRQCTDVNASRHHSGAAFGAAREGVRVSAAAASRETQDLAPIELHRIATGVSGSMCWTALACRERMCSCGGGRVVAGCRGQRYVCVILHGLVRITNR